jgi:shikimate dehydrogenase
MPVITGATRLYAIVGDPIAQAKSPLVYNARIDAAGRNACLVPWQLAPAAFEEGMRGLMRAGNVDGLIFTYPHKQAALALADIVKPRAAQVGATNAIRRRADGRWEADMFDGVGLVRALQEAGQPVAGQEIWVLGAGGAGGAIAFALADAGARTLYLTDLDGGKADTAAKAVSDAYSATAVSNAVPQLQDVAILVNATTVGLAPSDGLPFDATTLPRSLTVVDIVPRQDGTPLLALANACGCPTVGGSAMVEGQAGAVLDFFWTAA